MADYSLVVNSSFKPFTYDELIKPLQQETEEHNKLEDAYADLATKADVWERLANSQIDSGAYSMYKSYSDALRNEVDKLEATGLNPLSRQAMLNMRSRYSKEIAPIETAYVRRQALADEQRKLSAQDNSLRFERDAAGTSLNDFINNPSWNYGRSVSGERIKAAVSSAAANIAKEARDSKGGRGKLRKITLPYQYEYIKQNGFSRDAVEAVINNAEEGSPILKNIVKQAVEATGVQDWKNDKVLKEMYDYGNLGLYNAIGPTTSQIVTDEYNMKNDLAKNTEDRAAGKSGFSSITTNLPINSINITLPNTSGKKAYNKAKILARVLGMNEEGTNYYTGKKRTMGPSGIFTVQFFDRNGNFITEKDYIKSYTDYERSHPHTRAASEEHLKRSYRELVNRIYDTFGRNIELTANNIGAALKNYKNKGGAYSIEGLTLDIQDQDAVMNSIVNKLKHADSDNTSMKEITSVSDKNNTLVTEGSFNANDYFKDKADSKRKNLEAQFMVIPNAKKGKMTLAVKYDGKIYEIPKEKLGSIAMSMDKGAEAMYANINYRDRFLQAYKAKGYTEEQIKNSAEYRQIENNIKANLQASGIITAVEALAGKYKSSARDVHTTNENAN